MIFIFFNIGCLLVPYLLEIKPFETGHGNFPLFRGLAAVAKIRAVKPAAFANVFNPKIPAAGSDNRTGDHLRRTPDQKHPVDTHPDRFFQIHLGRGGFKRLSGIFIILRFSIDISPVWNFYGHGCVKSVFQHF